jgi:hypothetical protein
MLTGYMGIFSEIQIQTQGEPIVSIRRMKTKLARNLDERNEFAVSTTAGITAKETFFTHRIFLMGRTTIRFTP